MVSLDLKPYLDPAAIESHSAAFLLQLYGDMVRIRQFEERVKVLFLSGKMPGTIHQSQGQEACAVGVCQGINPDDFITSTHRPHGHALAKGLTLEEIFIELFGKGTGCCKGKGGSMHLGNIAKGMVPAIAIVGGGIPVATGMGLAFKMQKKPQVVACFFGDGAANEGAFHEGVNMASIWKLPVIFVCENNLYGASTAVSKVMNVPHVSDRASAYGIHGELVDGNDVLAVREATQRAAERCRNGEGPVLLELLTYRRTGHSRRDPCHYQPEDEQEFWFKRDPIDMLKNAVLDKGIATAADFDHIDQQIEAAIDHAIEVARAEPEPTIADLTTHVYTNELRK